jgi:hypothetical protein
MIVEEGAHTLYDGTQIEAGRVNVKRSSKIVRYKSKFSAAPIVFS